MFLIALSNKCGTDNAFFYPNWLLIEKKVRNYMMNFDNYTEDDKCFSKHLSNCMLVFWYTMYTRFSLSLYQSDASPHHPHCHHIPQTPRHNSTPGPAESSSTSIHSLLITEGNRMRRRNLFRVREDIIPYMPREWHTYHVLPLIINPKFNVWSVSADYRQVYLYGTCHLWRARTCSKVVGLTL